ncbi:MAG: hypothetical protein IJT34_07965 [Butyrivibrio sp.]|nr:hypothetical protein [Butyrivibrio sp.]
MDQYYEAGTAALWWLGQMGLILRSGHTTLCVDYYATPDDARQTRPPIPADALQGIDAFLGTHNHLNHSMLPKLRAFGPIDLELLPINGRDAVRYRRNCIGNMTWQEAADLAGEVAPGLVIPGHWDMFADNSADPQAFVDYLDIKYQGRIPSRIPRVLDKILYKKSST